MQRIKWTDRRFNFDFPAGIYPEMIERMRGTPARLEELLAGLSPETLTAQADGRWSMQENAGHLLDLESLVSQRIDEYLAGNAALHAADMSNRKTYEASHNDVPVASILNAFRTARHDIVRRLDSMDAGVFERAALHPRLNVQMRLVDMLFFQAEHDDYHLARISELKKLLLERRKCTE
ncbi:MAG TPA: DinB family protein [Pyrinomonadaceae bacterium]|nr:DinB family protein [Pyrinomonadaceae bacterium]